MGDTSISWTNKTWNPIRGCSRVSEGCRNCYAERVAARFSGVGQPYEGLARPGRKLDPVTNTYTLKDGSRWTGEVRLVPEHLADPLRWKKPRRIFVNSMSDLFHEKLTNEQIAAVFGVMAACPQHTFQVLTKRARRMREWFETPGTPQLVEAFRQVALAGRIEEYFADEQTLPIAGWNGYFVTSRGRVLSANGSDACQWCGVAIIGDLRKKFCSAGCKSKAHYEQQQGRWTPPEPSAKEMQPMPAESGHARVMLYRDGEQQRFLVHRLVLDAFDRPGREGEQACHIDGDATNNALWNLRWGTQSDNWDDSKRHGTSRRSAKLTDEQVAELRRLACEGVSSAELGRRFGISGTQARNIVSGKQWTPEYKPEWPLRSVWLGVSVENQEAADERIPELLRTPATVRFLSCEPLLGPVGLRMGGASMPEYAPHRPLPSLDWVIAGCESGLGARPCSVEWLRSLRDQCAAAGVPFFLKQAVDSVAKELCDDCGTAIRAYVCAPNRAAYSCGCTTEGSEDGAAPFVAAGDGSKRKAGGVIELPYLDGVQHAAFPEVSP